MSPTRSISQSLKTFGINEYTNDIVVVIPDPTNEQIAQIQERICGQELEPALLCQLQDRDTEQKLMKIYSINAQETQHSSLVDSIVTRMACRDIK